MNLTPARILLTASLLPLSTLWLSAADPTVTTTTTTTTTEQPVTAGQAAQSESVKRQQAIFNANQALADGQRFLASGKYDQAAERFQFILDAVAPGGSSAYVYSRACAGLAAAKEGQAEALAKDAKFKQAAQLLQEAINLQPTNPAYPKALKDLQDAQVAYERQVRDPEGTTYNPAVTDDFKAKVATVQKLIFQGDAYFHTGQYDKAEETYSKILILDPYNKTARGKMDHMERYKERAAEFRHDEYANRSLQDVAADWANSVSTDIVVPPKTERVENTGGNRAKITAKLNTIIIDKVNFDKLDINTVIQFLQDKSKELDLPTHEGINFVLRLSLNTPPTVDPTAPGAPTGAAPGAPAPPPSQPIHREVSIALDNVPLAELLRYITNQTNLQFSIEDYAVYLRPQIDEGETLTVRTFLVPANFFSGSALRITPAATTDYSVTTISSVTQDVQRELVGKGITFPPGATATYLPGSSKLVVRNTSEQLDLIANLIDNLSKETPQVTIEAKLAEFNENAIKSISFNYQVGASVINGDAGNFTSFGVSTALRTVNSTGDGNGGLSPNSIDTLIQNNPGNATAVFPLTSTVINPNSANVLAVGAVIDNTGLIAVMEAINNIKGASLLSAPSVTTQNGLKASIDIVREFPYPTSFEKPKLSSTETAYSTRTILGGFQSTPVQLALPPTPREFVTQDIGVSLEVKPTTYPDKRIDLDITKAQVVDFDGFIDYGVPITARLQEDTPAADEPGVIVTAGTINQPVFNLRSVVTNLQVLDGQTAVLGGLIREDTQEINDKVPVLGDLPLVGRLFQSKVSERVKKSLIIFVTAKLVKSNGKPQYVKTLSAEPAEEPLPEPPDIGPGTGVTLPPLPEGTPNS